MFEHSHVNQPDTILHAGLHKLTLDVVRRMVYTSSMSETTYSETWSDRIAALSVYVDREGNALVPSNYVEGNLNLGSWVSYLRTRRNNGKLSQAKVEQLEAFPGWEWGPLRPGPKTDAQRDAAIRDMRSNNVSLSAIGRTFDLSRQRIHQIVNS
jgi:hypothetical protein